MSSIATKEEIEILIKLQEIETGANKIRKFLDGVESEITVRKKKRREAENELAGFEADLEDVRSQYREFDGEVKGREVRIKKSEDYLKNAKTNTEYQVLQREIDDNKKRNSEAESQMLEFLDRIEAREKDVAQSRAKVETIVKETEKEIVEIESSTIDERKELEAILEKRDAVAATLRPRLRDMFTRILKQSNGLAIVPMTNATCNGCFMNVPPQKFIEIQRGETLNFCPQCHRMLYFKAK
jgi:hypothetical protein